MKTILSFCTLYLFMIASPEVNAQEPQQPELAKEIIAMRDTDQKLRRKWAKMAKKGNRESKKFKKLTDEALAADSLNTIRMKAIVSKYGWPTKTLVGSGASNSAWLLVQHADRDPLFQMKCLPLLKEAMDAGEINPLNYAFLYDRVQVARGKKQLYATQSTTNNGISEGTFYPLEDESNVQVRREALGFEQHVEDYAKNYGIKYKIPSVEEAQAKALNYKKVYAEQVTLGKTAYEDQDYLKAADHYIKAMENYGSLQNEDLVATAKAISLAQHKESPYAYAYLLKAVINGYPNSASIVTDPDFDFIKRASPRNWKTLLQTIQFLKSEE